MKALQATLIALAGLATGAGTLSVVGPWVDATRDSSTRASAPPLAVAGEAAPPPYAWWAGNTTMAARALPAVALQDAAWSPAPAGDAAWSSGGAAPSRREAAGAATPSRDPVPPADPDESRIQRLAAPEPAPPRVLPQGTFCEAVLETPLSSRSALAGDPVRAMVAADVLLEGRTALPAGSILTGVVREARPAGRVKGNGYLAIAFTQVLLPDGYRTSMNASHEETARGKTKRDASIIGGSAAGGALLGQLLGKDSESTVGGAALGGVIGAGVVLANKGRDLDLAAGHRIILATASPVSLPAAD